jgi:hypothetical protein
MSEECLEDLECGCADVRLAGVLYPCKGVPGSAKAMGAHTSQREREKERYREGEREEKEINRKMMTALKGMTGALAPFSYLV